MLLPRILLPYTVEKMYRQVLELRSTVKDVMHRLELVVLGKIEQFPEFPVNIQLTVGLCQGVNAPGCCQGSDPPCPAMLPTITTTPVSRVTAYKCCIVGAREENVLTSAEGMRRPAIFEKCYAVAERCHAWVWLYSF